MECENIAEVVRIIKSWKYRRHTQIISFLDALNTCIWSVYVVLCLITVVEIFWDTLPDKKVKEFENMDIAWIVGVILAVSLIILGIGIVWPLLASIALYRSSCTDWDRPFRRRLNYARFWFVSTLILFILPVIGFATGSHFTILLSPIARLVFIYFVWKFMDELKSSVREQEMFPS